MRIFSFGCSFSTRTIFDKEEFWLDILSKKLECTYEAWGSGGSDVHESYHRLTGSMKDFQRGDLIIYQFSDHNRIGYQYNMYGSTALLSKGTIEETLELFKFLREVNKSDKEDEDYEILYKFSQKWADGQIFFHYWRVWNLLKFLEERIGIDFILLFLDQTWTNVIPEDHYLYIPKFPIPKGFWTPKYDISDPSKNVALNHYVWNNNLAVAHEEKEVKARGLWWHPNDGHPSIKGHQAIASILYDHMLSRINRK